MNWRNKGLTVLGKTTMLNALVGSLFVYKRNVLANIYKTMIESIEHKKTNIHA